MAFHVEISRGFQSAREFNLDGDRLRQAVLDLWVGAEPVALGDREWEPAECRLKVLEGPALTGPDLAFGRGWHNAERSAEDVTRRLLEAAARSVSLVAVLAETTGARDAVTAGLNELGLESVDWAEAERSERRPVAAILAVERPDPDRAWLFEAGRAVGALAGRAVAARLEGAEVPPELARLDSVSLDSRPSQALAAGLARIGLAGSR